MNETKELGNHQDSDERFRLPKLLIGAALFAAGGLLPYAASLPNAVSLILFLAAYITLGAGVVWEACRNLLHGRIFDENFLMTVSTVGAFLIGEVPEAVAVMLLYQLGEFLEDLALDRSRDSISSLLAIRPDTATLADGKTVVPADDVAVGTRILVKPGERIPLDGVVVDGESRLDTRALTGESVPRTVHAGEPVLAGCVNESAVLTVEVTKPAGESTAAKMLELVEHASEQKAPAEAFITRFARVYTPVVVLLALLLAVVPPIFLTDSDRTEWIRRGINFLVISCPCALVISVPLTFFCGIGRASRDGILIKGSRFLESLAKAGTVVFDKTGTLTKGNFVVTAVEPADGWTAEELLACAAHAEAGSNHPIAESIRAAYAKPTSDGIFGAREEISGRGVAAEWNGQRILVGNRRLLQEAGISSPGGSGMGTEVLAAVNGQYAGRIVIADEIREESAPALEKLRQAGVTRFGMLTGDRAETAKAVADALGIAEVRAELLPGDKVEALEAMMQTARGKTVFVGDGMNDAPVLARSDVGVAMGAYGSDAAIEAADVVLMTDDPTKLARSIRLARSCGRIVRENMVLAIAAKAVFLLLGALGRTDLWLAVLGDVGVMLAAVANAVRMLRK